MHVSRNTGRVFVPDPWDRESDMTILSKAVNHAQRGTYWSTLEYYHHTSGS